MAAQRKILRPALGGDPGTGRKQVRRVLLPGATSAAQAQAELRRLLTKRDDNALPVLKLPPKISTYAAQTIGEPPR